MLQLSDCDPIVGEKDGAGRGIDHVVIGWSMLSWLPRPVLRSRLQS